MKLLGIFFLISTVALVQGAEIGSHKYSRDNAMPKKSELLSRLRREAVLTTTAPTTPWDNYDDYSEEDGMDLGFDLILQVKQKVDGAACCSSDCCGSCCEGNED